MNSDNILIPKHLYNINVGDPVFFLAGPVRGGGDWQKDCAEMIVKAVPCARIAIPYYHTSEEHFPLREIARQGTGAECSRQLNWERYYLDLASKIGCVIFWLPAESKTKPRTDGMYACDTRGEIGEWRGRLMGNRNLRVVVGGETDKGKPKGEGFYGFDQIERNFKEAVGSDFMIYPTLNETVESAIRKAAL